MEVKNTLPLYLGKCLGDLNTMVDEVRLQNPRLVAKSAPKVFQSAEETRIKGDEEKSYILYMRYYKALQTIFKSRDYKNDKDYFDKMVNKKTLKTACEWAEKLAKSLEVRYDLLKEEAEVENKLSKIDNHQEEPVNINNVKIEIKPKAIELNGMDVPKVVASNPEFITCQKLYPLLVDDETEVIIMDTRSARDFSESHIKHQSCINIPSEAIKPGITAPKLDSVLPTDSQQLWKRRAYADIIVLMDWFGSSQQSISQEISSLKDAIFKWDTKTILKSEPLILCGGYDSWITYYPTWTTKSNVEIPIQSHMSLNSDLISLDFEYPSGDLDKAFIESTVTDEVETSLTNNLNMLNIMGPKFDRTLKPKPLSFSKYPDEVNQIDNYSSNSPKIKTSEQIVPFVPGKSIPAVNRTIKPAITNKVSFEKENGGEISKPDQLVQAVIDSNNKHLDAVLSLEKQQLLKEQEFIKIRLQREKEAEESMKLELQKQETILLDKLSHMEKERQNLDFEFSKLKEENDELKQNIEHLLKIEDYKKLKPEMDAVQKKDEERKKLEQEVKRLREERKKKQNQTKEDIPAIPKCSPKGSPAIKKREVDNAENIPTSERIGSETRFMRLKDEGFSESKDNFSRRNLSRSCSFPNISQLYDSETTDFQESSGEASKHVMPQSVSIPQDRIVPLVDRNSKPSQIEINAASNRNFMPVFGGQGRALTGLRNLGNTCYMNSVIQALANTVPLMQYFVSGSYRNDISRGSKRGHQGELVEEFVALIRALWTGQYRSISPKDFKRVMSNNKIFEGYEQQDSHEFLMILMDSLQEDLNKLDQKQIREIQNEEKSLQDSNLAEDKLAIKSWEIQKSLNNSIISKLFKGQEKSTLRCLNCGKTSTKFGTFTCLSLSIPAGNRCTLYDCLKTYITEEKLTGSQKWECPRCNVLREAVKKLDILRLPQILLIQLKRFFNEGVWRKKIQTFVDFPIDQLDLKSFANVPREQAVYNLYAVSNHYGTMEGGHCIAFCKNVNYNRWFKFDDQNVQEMKLADVKSSAAYILYYTSANT